MLISPALSIDSRFSLDVDTFLPFEDPQLLDLQRSGTHVLDRSSVIAPVSNDNRCDILAVQSAAKMLLRSYWMHLADSVRLGLVKQTNAVLDADDWEDEICNASLDSYKTMLRTLVELQPRCRPILGVSECGNFLGAWRRNSSKVVVEFMPNDRMKWMVALAHQDATDRAAGQTNVSNIRTIIDAHAGRALVDGEE